VLDGAVPDTEVDDGVEQRRHQPDRRVRDGTVEHSWSLVDRDVESEWLRV